MEKIKITNAQLLQLIREAKAIPGMRIGQHVVNTLLPAGGEATADLFYCDDSELLDTMLDYVEIV